MKAAHPFAPWTVALAAPLAGFFLLLAAPGLDVHWEDHPAHFWLVLAASAINAILAYLTGAGFLGLHALATPGVLLDGRTAGFVIATPVGLAAAAAFAAGSTVA